MRPLYFLTPHKCQLLEFAVKQGEPYNKTLLNDSRARKGCNGPIFGLVKKLYRRTSVSTMSNNEDVVWQSNTGHQNPLQPTVNCQTGERYVTWYRWDEHLRTLPLCLAFPNTTISYSMLLRECHCEGACRFRANELLYKLTLELAWNRQECSYNYSCSNGFWMPRVCLWEKWALLLIWRDCFNYLSRAYVQPNLMPCSTAQEQQHAKDYQGLQSLP